jgi:uncharacterized membrane protein
MLAAVTLTMLAGFGALAIDLSHLYYSRRSLQAAVDAAALSAVHAPATIERQGFAGVTPIVTLGNYAPDPARSVTARFAPGGAANAVRVRAETTMPLTLGRLFAGTDRFRVDATAVATHEPVAGFTIGSGLASLNGGVLNAVLGSLLGTSLSLTVADYNGLAAARVDALRFLDTLATNLDLTAGTYSQLLDSRVRVGEAVYAATEALSSTEGAPFPAAQTLASVATRVNLGRTVRVGDLLDIGVQEQRQVGLSRPSSPYARVGVNALDLLRGAATLGGSEHAVTLPMTIAIPGVAQGTARLMMIEPPASAPPPAAEGRNVLGPVGVQARTAQIRLHLDLRLLNVTTLLGLPAEVRLPILVEVAWATGRLTSVTCDASPTTDTQMTVRVNTGIATARLGEANALAFANAAESPTPSPARIVTLAPVPLLPHGLTVTGAATARRGAGRGDLRFNAAEIAAGTVKTVSSGPGLGALMGSLAQDLRLTLQPATSPSIPACWRRSSRHSPHSIRWWPTSWPRPACASASPMSVRPEHGAGSRAGPVTACPAGPDRRPASREALMRHHERAPA